MKSCLSLENLSTAIVDNDHMIEVLHHISFDMVSGKIYALIGESGSGKSMTANAIMRFLPENILTEKNSHIYFKNTDLFNLSESDMRKIRGKKIAMIFQEPMSALNPVMTIFQQLKEIVTRHSMVPRKEIKAYLINLLHEVELEEHCLYQYPHQLSGGMRQRIIIAMALAGKPDIIIADEPTTALDSLTEKRILDLLVSLSQKNHLSLLLITHNIQAVAAYADILFLMYSGEILASGIAADVLQHPRHPYAYQLLATLPDYEKRDYLLPTILGQAPALSEKRIGCAFVNRCLFALPICATTPPKTYVIEGQSVKCHLYENGIFSLSDKSPPHPLSKNPRTNPRVLLSIDKLCKQFYSKGKELPFKALDEVSFTLFEGECFALVGGSGSGKTSLAKIIAGLTDFDSGEILFKDQQLFLSSRKARAGMVQLIFQDPYYSLNPKLTILEILEESLQYTRGKHERVIADMLEKVGLSMNILHRFPHEFSGGQRQRIAIARALLLKPQLLICDEPTSALDVSIQSQILNLLKSLQQEYHLSILFITHNFSVVSYLADRVGVMDKGRLLEINTIESILDNPQHNYTKALLAAGYKH
jgi:peptide/nickel transport system ATP-binding protein